jgi:hypothetical protein
MLACAAVSSGWIAAVACSNGAATSTAPSYQAVCTRAAALACAHETVDQCVADAHHAADVAQQAGCSAEFDRGFQCTDAHPDHCEGDVLVQDTACESVGQALADCLTTSDPASLCKLSANDPCTQCVCKECVCDAECQKATPGWVACESACALSDAGDFTGCFSRCTAATSAPFQKYLACPGSSVCASACAGDGGVSGP